MKIDQVRAELKLARRCVKIKSCRNSISKIGIHVSCTQMHHILNGFYGPLNRTQIIYDNQSLGIVFNVCDRPLSPPMFLELES